MTEPLWEDEGRPRVAAMGPVKVRVPAKINLHLGVGPLRDDGFHELVTIYHAIALYDELTARPADSLALTMDGEGAGQLALDDTNLVIRAVKTFAAVTGREPHARLHLRKQIPLAAGLAGGSADAAATLVACDALWSTGYTREDLASVAATLGSDIPFFLLPGAVRCTGRGEILEPVAPPPALPVVLLKPSFGVATPDAYKRWKDAEPLPGIAYDPQRFPWGELVNDLEKPVFQKHRFLAEAKQWLLDRPETAGALMSGSGSTMFAVLRDPAGAEALIAAARAELDPTLWAWSGFTDGAPN